jgi:hypothetical protein
MKMLESTEEAKWKNKVKKFHKITKSIRLVFSHRLQCAMIKIVILLERMRW